MPDNTAPSQIDLVRLALALDHAEVRGAEPTLLELDLFITGQLSDQRRQEVLSHLAHSQEVFDQWWVMSRNLDWLKSQSIPVNRVGLAVSGKPGRLRGWLDRVLSPPVYGLAMVALMAVLMLPLLPIGKSSSLLDEQYQRYLQADYASLAAPWPVGEKTKSLPIDNAANRQRLAVRTGIEVGLNVLGLQDSWFGWIEEDSAVADESHPLTQLGKWALLTYAVCENSDDAVEANEASLSEFLSVQQEVLSSIVQTIDESEASVLQGLQEKGVVNPCEFAVQVLAVGVTPKE